MTGESYTLINVDAIKHNVVKIREYAPHAKIMAVIKANAYGHDLLIVAKALNDVDGFAVARISEGIFLRTSEISSRIVILSGFVSEGDLDTIAKYNLEVVVHSIEQIKILQDYRGHQKFTVWLKLNTGMNRLGFSTAEFAKVYQLLNSSVCVNQPVSLMTHLSSSDEMESPKTLQQIKLFNKAVSGYCGEKSIANSAGIIGWPDSLTDWVRPGLMLYGVSPFLDRNGKDLGLKPVMSLHSKIISINNIPAGESVGYSETWVSKKMTRIGVIGIGYGDGYPRYAKTGTPVLVNGQIAPLVGRVSMDMITVDITDQENAKPGDPVTLWGEGLSVEEIAKYADTIPYTLLCGISQRVQIKVCRSGIVSNPSSASFRHA